MGWAARPHPQEGYWHRGAQGYPLDKAKVGTCRSRQCVCDLTGGI